MTSTSTSSSSVVTYEVVITADNPDLKLKPRLTANVTIFTMEEENVLLVPNKALRFIPEPKLMETLGLQVNDNSANIKKGEKFVWVKENNVLVTKAITVGVSNNNYTEILGGLNEGEVVAVDLESEMPVAGPSAERSPFMPGPPGRK